MRILFSLDDAAYRDALRGTYTPVGDWTVANIVYSWEYMMSEVRQQLGPDATLLQIDVWEDGQVQVFAAS